MSASPSPPDSPKIYYSQLRQAQHHYDEQQSDEEMIVITVDEKVSDWRRRNELDNMELFVVDDDGQVYVHKDQRN